MKTGKSPFKAHLFLCTKSRGGERKSCGDGNNADLKNLLKDEVQKRGWKPKIRISESSCLGVCEAGPNIMIYPQQIWFSDVKTDDIASILQTLQEIVES